MINTKAIMIGSIPSLNMNQFFDKPNFAPKIPIPPVSRILMKPRIDIKLMLLRFSKS